MHYRTRILQEIETRLRDIDGFASAGKVERWRTKDIPEERLPALTVTWADADERAISRPGAGPDNSLAYYRELPVSIVVHLRASNPDDIFDETALAIEAILADDETLGGLVIDTLLTSSRLYVDPQTGLPLGAGRLVYMVTYSSVAANPALKAL